MTGPEKSRDWPAPGTAYGLYFMLSFVYFLPALLPGRHIFGTDYLAAGYFFQDFINDRFAQGAIPAWVPYLYGGVPFFANPASLFYPVRLVADLLLPTDRIFPALFIVQFAAAGAGMYLLARELGCRRWVSLVAGLAFQFTGVTASWVYAGHDGRIITGTLAPLLLFFLHRGVRTGGLAPFAGAAATLGCVLLSFQIQTAYYLLLGAALWSFFCLFHLGIYERSKALAGRVALGLGAVLFGFALAAVNFLPFLGYVGESPRGAEGGRGYEYSVSWSMPPAEVIGLAVPEQSGASVSDPETGEPMFPEYDGANPFKLHTEYAGATVIVLLALAVAYSRRSRYLWFFLGLSLFALTLAFGGHTPIYRLYYELLPGTKRFRAPDLAFFLVPVALAAVAAISLERLALLREVPGRQRQAGLDPLRLVPRVAAGVVAAALAGALVNAGNAEVALGWARFAFFAALVGGALWLWSSRRVGTVAAAAILALATTADLWIVGKRFLHTIPPPSQTFAADDVARFLDSQPDPFRVWVLPFPAGTAYRNHGDYLMLFDVEQAGGEHGNQLQRYNEFVGAGEDVYVDWHNFLQYPVFLNLANIRYIVSGVELQGLPEVHRGSALVYQNPGSLPRAWLVPEVVVAEPPRGALAAMKEPGFDPRVQAVVYDSVPGLSSNRGPLRGRAEVLVHEPSRVVVRTSADRASLLVLADNFHRDWRVTVDGEPGKLVRANHTFRGVPLAPGAHQVVFEFKPAELYTGLAIYLAGFGLLAGYGALLLARRRKAHPDGAR
ncbi:MAG: YfhO family protein [Longimicrobiaceae bacterium]